VYIYLFVEESAYPYNSLGGTYRVYSIVLKGK